MGILSEAVTQRSPRDTTFTMPGEDMRTFDFTTPGPHENWAMWGASPTVPA